MSHHDHTVGVFCRSLWIGGLIEFIKPGYGFDHKSLLPTVTKNRPENIKGCEFASDVSSTWTHPCSRPASPSWCRLRCPSLCCTSPWPGWHSPPRPAACPRTCPRSLSQPSCQSWLSLMMMMHDVCLLGKKRRRSQREDGTENERHTWWRGWFRPAGPLRGGQAALYREWTDS